MIVFDLRCGQDHVFEAWFGSTADYEAQGSRGLVACPICDDRDIVKAAMAPAVPAKSNRGASPATIKRGLAMLAKAQAEVLSKADYVGDRFTAEARAIDAGETAARAIYGEATPAQAAGLAADGIDVQRIPLPIPAKADA